MKRLLLASAALVATAGVAAAEVKFSGFGRFGIGYWEDREQRVNAQDDVSDTILVSRFRLDIDAIAETDGGAKFEARLRVEANEDPDDGEANTATENGARFSVSYGGLRVDAGNVGGAIDNLNKRSGFGVGLESFAEQTAGVNYSHLGYAGTGAGGNAVFFKYEVGGFGIGASYDQRNDPTTPTEGDRWDISATYTVGNITAAVAHGQTDAGTGRDDPSLTILTLHGEFGDLEGALLVADDQTKDARTDGSAFGLSVAYTLGAAKLQFVYGDGSAEYDHQRIGVGAHYDLGGGASLRGGIARQSARYVNTGGEYDKIRADFGAYFDF